MDALFLVLSVFSLCCAFAYAFVLYGVLRVLIGWARERAVAGDLPSVPLLLRLPPRAVSALLALCFLAVVL